MKRDDYDKQLIRWVKNHYWDSLERHKDLILRHMRTFAGTHTIDSRAVEALEIIGTYNRIRNDLEAYLHDVIQWGQGRGPKPKPEDFGIKI